MSARQSRARSSRRSRPLGSRRSRSRGAARPQSPGQDRDRAREGLRSPRRRSPDHDDAYAEVYRASLRTSSETVRVGFLAQFVGSTSQGKDLSETALTQVAVRVQAWGVVVHDLHNFTNEDLQEQLSRDPESGEGAPPSPGPALIEGRSSRLWTSPGPSTQTESASSS